MSVFHKSSKEIWCRFVRFLYMALGVYLIFDIIAEGEQTISFTGGEPPCPAQFSGNPRAHGKAAQKPHQQGVGAVWRGLPATDNAVLSGLLGIAKLGGYMVFFNLLNILFVPFTRLPDALLNAYCCILEITGGIARCGARHPFLVLVMLPFGGFSCIAQTYSMIRDAGLSIRAYVFHKLAQTALTALIYMLWQPF